MIFQPLSDETLERARAHVHGGEVPPPVVDLPGDIISWSDKYLPFPLSPAWRAFLCALYGLPVPAPRMLKQLCDFEEPRPESYDDGVVIAGRRSGKSAIAGVGLGLFEAMVRGPEHVKFLAPGQRAHVVVVCRTLKQSLECFRYARSVVERNPELSVLLECDPLESQSGGELRFRCGTVLSVFPASKSSTRGFTIVAAVLDEFCWIASDSESADQDSAIYDAIRFGMLKPEAAPRRRRIIISSPAGRSGLVFDLYSKYYGQAHAPVLVARAATFLWNPSISRRSLEPERERDPRVYSREVLAEFVDVVSVWCDGHVIDSAAIGRDAEPRDPGAFRYFAACDLAFKRDRSILCIAHMEMTTGPRPVSRLFVDGLWAWVPSAGTPLDARAVVREMSQHLSAYNIRRITGDQFASIPISGEFKDNHIEFIELTATSTTKFEHFTRLRELFYGARISLPNVPEALQELRELRETITSAGNVRIAAPDRATAHDDYACAVAWCYAAAELNHCPAAPMPASAMAWLDY